MEFSHVRIVPITVLVVQLAFLSLLMPFVVIGSEGCLPSTLFHVYDSTQHPYGSFLDTFSSFQKKCCSADLDETVVIGAVTERSFWEQLTCGRQVNGIIVHSGVKQAIFVSASSLMSGLDSDRIETGIRGASTVVAAEGCLSNILFYMYGQTTCPHCSSQDDFFKQNFPNNYFYCPIDKYQECYNAASQFALFLVNKGIPLDIAAGVPQILVVKNNTGSPSIIAVVVGELRERSFWLQIACSTPSIKIPIYVSTGSGGSIVAEIDVNTTNHSELIRNYIVFPATPGEKFDPQILRVVVVIAVLAITVGGYTIYIHVHRRLEKQAISKKHVR